MGRSLNVMAFGFAVGAAMFGSGVSLAQQSRILICGDQPNPPSGYQIELDYANSRVQYLGQWHQARFSDQAIQWNVPRYEPGTGEVRVGQRFYLDRIQGTLRSDPECLPRDWDICRGLFSYCRVGQGIF